MKTDDLQPSGIGEILDRAIATYVRSFAPLFVILALTVVPLSLMQYFAQPDTARYFGDLQKVLTLPSGDAAERARVLAEINARSRPGGATLLAIVAALAFYPLSRNALLTFAAAGLDGRPVSIARAYRASLARWVPQLVVGAAFIALGAAGLAAVFVLAFVVALAVGVLAVASKLVAIAVGVPAGIAAVAATIGLYALLYIAWQMAGVCVADEDANPFRAIGHGLRRTLDRTLFVRTLLVALSLLAIELFGALAMLAFGVLVVSLTHIAVLEALVSAAGAIVIDGVRSLFVLVYTRDVRMRREGADLLAAADEALQPA